MKAANIFLIRAALLLLLISSFASQGRPSVFISSVQFQGHPNAIAINFSEGVEAASALLTSNYSLSTATGGVTISSAYFYTNGTTRVILTTFLPLTFNVAYRLNAANVRNAAATQTISNTSLTVNVGAVALGVVERRFFGDIGGGVLPSDLTNSVRFINNQPDLVDYPAGIDQNSDIGDNYGQQFRGYFVAPRGGTTTFYVSSDDGSDLYLSSDENPANKVLIAREEQWSRQSLQFIVGAKSPTSRPPI